MIDKITPRKLNTSKDARLQGELEMYDAYNISVSDFEGDQDSGAVDGESSGTQTGDQGVIKPAKGNQVIANSFTGTEKRRVLGSVADEVNGTIYCFVFSEIAAEQGVYKTSGEGLTPVYTSAYFNFPSTGFVRADLVYHKGSPILYFTDGVNEPRKLNVQDAATTTFTEGHDIVDFITACPKTPMHRPSFTFDSDPTKPTNFRNVEGFQFAYQCVYKTGEESAISSYSNVAVPPSYLNQGALSEPSLISDNVIVVKVPDVVGGVRSFTQNIDKIRLLVRIGGRGTFFEVEEKDYDSAVASALGGVFFEFSNDSVITAIPEEDVLKLNDALPKRAESQAIVNDRLMYGNYTEGFDELDNINCSLDVFFNERGEEFADLEVGIKKVMLPVGYNYGVNIQYDSDLKSSLGTDDGTNSLIHNRRASYQFDVSGLPSRVPAGTEMRIRLNIRPDRNFEIYDSRNSFHTFKNRGYDTGASDLDSQSKNGTTITIKDMDDNDSDMPSVAQFNKGVVLEGVGWTSVTAFDNTSQSDTGAGGLTGVGNQRVSTGHSPSCPFIIPTTSFDFKLGIRFTEEVVGEGQIKGIITNALINYLTYGQLNPAESVYLVDETVELIFDSSQDTAVSDVDQGLSNEDGYGRISESDPRAQTVMQLFNYEEIVALNTSDHLLSSTHPGARGFVCMNKARVSANLLFNEAATNAVNATSNDVGPIFSINISEVTGSNGTGNPEYHTMIPRIMPDGSKGWWWASRTYMANASDGDVFVEGEHDVIGLTIEDLEGSSLSTITTNKNLWFSLNVPLPMGSQWNLFETPQGPLSAHSPTNFFNDEVVDQSLYEDFYVDIGFFEQYQQAHTCSSLSDRYSAIGYLSDTPLLQIVSTRENFSGNNDYQKYSVVDGEVNVRRSKAFGDKNQNFWYGILFGTEYAGKQNRQFPLSRGWDGSGGYPGVLSGKFDYANTNNADLIDSDINESTVKQILDEAYPDIEVKSFSTSVQNTNPSQDPQSRSFKRYCSHDFGVVFYDERGRPGNVYPIGSVLVQGYDSSDNTGSAFVTASFQNDPANIPDYAQFYKLVYGGNSTISDFTQYTAGGAFIPADSLNEDGLIYVSLNYLQENNLVSYSKAFGAVRADGDKDLYNYSEGDRLRVISYYENEDERIFVNDEDHNFDVVGTVTLGETENPLVGDNEDVHPAKVGQFVILKNNSRAQGFRYEDVSQSPALGAGTNTESIYNSNTNFWNKRCVFEIYSPIKKKEAEDRIYHEIGKTYNIITANGVKNYQVPNVILTEGDVFFRKSAVNMQSFVGNSFVGLIGNGVGVAEESIEPNFKSYYLEAKAFTDRFPNADVMSLGKPRTVSRVKEEVKRIASIKFSDKGNPASNIVRYTSFNDSKLPFKDLQNNDGPINSLVNFNDSLFCIQQLKASSIPVSRTLLADALGNETVIGTSKVLGTEKYYAGTYGTNHPESVTKVDNFVYFVSSDFRQIYRFNPSKGIEVISEKGMGSFFDSQLNFDGSAPRVVGGYDPENDEFLVSINNDVAELSSVDAIAGLAIPDGSIFEDSIDTFIGASLDGTVPTGISDSNVSDILSQLVGLDSLLDTTLGGVSDTFDSINTLEELVSADFTDQSSNGQSIVVDVAGTPITVGPFTNASTYNSQLSELQSGLFSSLATQVSNYLRDRGIIENRTLILANLTSDLAIALRDRLYLVRDVVDSIDDLLPRADQAAINNVAADVLAGAGIADAAKLEQFIINAEELASDSTTVKNLFDSTEGEVIDQEYALLQATGSDQIALPPQYSTEETVTSVSTVVVDGFSLGAQALDLASAYQSLVTTVGTVDMTGALGALVDNAVQGLDTTSDALTDALEMLYGPDGIEGTPDDSEGLVGQLAAALDEVAQIRSIAYGSDGKSVAEGGALGDGGLDSELDAAQTKIDTLISDYSTLFDLYAQNYVNIYGTGNVESGGSLPETTLTEYLENQISEISSANTGTWGGSFLEQITNLLAEIDRLQGELDAAPTIGDAQEVDQIRKQKINLQYILETLLGAETALNVLGEGLYFDEVNLGIDFSQAIQGGELSEDGTEVIGNASADAFIANVSEFIQRVKMPIPTLMTFAQILDAASDEAGLTENDFAISPYFRQIALNNIKEGLEEQIARIQEEGYTSDVNFIVNYLAAYKNITANSDLIQPLSSFEDVETFGQQIVESEAPPEPTEGEVQTFTALMDLLKSGQLSREQVIHIIDSARFYPETQGSAADMQFNKGIFLDTNRTNNIGTADLLVFLPSYGQSFFDTGGVDKGFGGVDLGEGLPD